MITTNKKKVIKSNNGISKMSKKVVRGPNSFSSSTSFESVKSFSVKPGYSTLIQKIFAEDPDVPDTPKPKAEADTTKTSSSSSTSTSSKKAEEGVGKRMKNWLEKHPKSKKALIYGGGAVGLAGLYLAGKKVYDNVKESDEFNDRKNSVKNSILSEEKYYSILDNRNEWQRLIDEMF